MLPLGVGAFAGPPDISSASISLALLSIIVLPATASVLFLTI
jgi:hypothetical protein